MYPTAPPIGFGDTSGSSSEEDGPGPSTSVSKEEEFKKLAQELLLEWQQQPQYGKPPIRNAALFGFDTQKKQQKYGKLPENGKVVPNLSTRNNNMLDQIEALVERNKRVDEQARIIHDVEFIASLPLVDYTNSSLDTSNNTNGDYKDWDVVSQTNGVVDLQANHLPNKKLPKKSIQYDYNCYPIRIKEINREFMQKVHALSSPFLRPIIIDGIGMIKAYWENASDDDEDSHPKFILQDGWSFPLVPIVRCLFYWISRGHYTVVCFPEKFSPLSMKEYFGVNDEQSRALATLHKLGMVKYFEPENNFCTEWFTQKKEALRACLVTSVVHCTEGMQCNLQFDYEYQRNHQIQMIPERILQPFFGPNADLVFFAPILNCNKPDTQMGSQNQGNQQFMADIVLDNGIISEQQFRKLERYQLNFTDQVKQLKALYDVQTKKKQQRETNVMCAIMERLEPFL